MIISTHLKAILKIVHTDSFYERWAAIFNAVLPQYEINTKARIACFLAQCAHESAEFTRLSENMNYSAAGLINTFPKYFNSESALAYARKPQLIGSYVYANRFGNGGPETGDGYKYRGRGLIGVTFKDNYSEMGKELGIDLVAMPELLHDEALATKVSCIFWKKKGLNKICDSGDFDLLTRRINGGLNGLKDRKEYFDRAMRVL